MQRVEQLATDGGRHRLRERFRYVFAELSGATGVTALDSLDVLAPRAPASELEPLLDEPCPCALLVHVPADIEKRVDMDVPARHVDDVGSAARVPDDFPALAVHDFD